MIIAIVGMPGSGKSIAGDMFKQEGYKYLRFGQIILDEVKKRGLEPLEENERPIREELRKKHGMAAIAILNLPKIKKLGEKIVIDGLYSWSEYKILKEKFKEKLIIITTYTPPQLRYERLTKRTLKKEDTELRNRPMCIESAKARDYAEIENSEKGGPIAMSDYLISNTGTEEEFKTKIKNLIKKL